MLEKEKINKPILPKITLKENKQAHLQKDQLKRADSQKSYEEKEKQPNNSFESD